MGACMCEGVCLLLGLSKPSWHWVPVVHHARSLAAGHKAVGASPTCAWRNDPAASWGSCGVEAWRCTERPCMSWRPCGVLLEVHPAWLVWMKTRRPMCISEWWGSPGKPPGTCARGDVLLPALHPWVDRPRWPMWVTLPLPMAESYLL